MTADLAVSLLNRAANGAEMLQILETLTAEGDAAAPADAQPTLQDIQF
jgi:hypothetical protein